jgi:hypothetical protein
LYPAITLSLDYAQANALYCNLVQLNETQQLIIKSAMSILQSLRINYNNKQLRATAPVKPCLLFERIVSILKAFAYTQHKKEKRLLQY